MFTLIFFGGPTPAMNFCLHANFKFGGVTVLAVQLFNKNKRKKGKEERRQKHEKTYFAVLQYCVIFIYYYICSVPFRNLHLL